jgi:hypothetical protein
MENEPEVVFEADADAFAKAAEVDDSLAGAPARGGVAVRREERDWTMRTASRVWPRMRDSSASM